MLCYRNPLQIVLCKIINDTHKAQVSLESVIISLCPECHQTLHCSDLQRYIHYPCCECTGDVFIRRRAGRGRGPVCLVHDRRVPPLKLHFVVWKCGEREAVWREREIGSVEREGDRQCGERERDIGSVEREGDRRCGERGR